jgi:hypothetical protein
VGPDSKRDNIESGNPVTADERNKQLAATDEAAKPHAELFLVVASALVS